MAWRRCSRARRARRSIEAGDDGQSRDLAFLEGIEERVVILERDAAERVSPRTEHVGVREQAGASENLAVAADWRKPNGFHAVEQALAQFEIVHVRRRRTVHPHVDE